MEYRIQFMRTEPDGNVTPVPIDALIGPFLSVHEAAVDADRRMREADRIGADIRSYMVVDSDGKPVDPLGKPIE